MVDSAPAPVLPASPPASQVLAEQRAGNRDAALAALKQIRDGSEAPAAPAAQVTAPPAGDQVPTDPAAAPEAAPPADPAPAPEAVAAPDPAPPATPPTPAEPPGMAAVRKQEQHLRKQLAAERAQMQQEFEQQRAQWQQKLDAAAARQSKIDDAARRRDAIALLQEHGFSEQDFDPVGRLIYAASPAGKKDPAAAAAAAQELARSGQSREVMTTVEKLQQEIADLRQAHQQTIAQQQAQANLDRYMASVTKEIGDATPLARAAMAKNPDRTRNMLTQIADELYTASGPSDDMRDVPTPAEVIAAYEARRTAELEELGIDPKMIGRSAAAPATIAPPAAPAARPAATIAPSSVAATTVPKAPGPPDRNEVLAGLAKLRTVG